MYHLRAGAGAGAGGRSLPLLAPYLTTSSSAPKLSPPLPNLRRPPALHRSLAAITTLPGYDAHLEALFQKKRDLRTYIRKALRTMTTSQRSLEDDAIHRIVVDAPWFKSARSVCAYANCEALREVDTSTILSSVFSENCAKNRKRLYLPRIEDRNSNMTMLHVSSYADLVPNSMNILEPPPHHLDGNRREDAMQANKPVDLFIIPGLAFDRAGKRLGRSGGYYDLYLKKYRQVAMENGWKLPLLVALAYSVQVVDDGAIALTSVDVPVDAIVSPSGVIYTSNAGWE